MMTDTTVTLCQGCAKTSCGPVSFSTVATVCWKCGETFHTWVRCHLHPETGQPYQDVEMYVCNDDWCDGSYYHPIGSETREDCWVIDQSPDEFYERGFSTDDYELWVIPKNEGIRVMEKSTWKMPCGCWWVDEPQRELVKVCLTCEEIIGINYLPCKCPKLEEVT